MLAAKNPASVSNLSCSMLYALCSFDFNSWNFVLWKGFLVVRSHIKSSLKYKSGILYACSCFLCMQYAVVRSTIGKMPVVVSSISIAVCYILATIYIYLFSAISHKPQVVCDIVM
jgi:hypothetical protein